MDSLGYSYVFMHLYIYVTIIIKGKEAMNLKGNEGNMGREEVGNYIIVFNLLSYKKKDLILHHIRWIQLFIGKKYSHWKGRKIKT